MLSTDFSTDCAPSFIQNTDIFIVLLGIRAPETKDLSAHTLTITSKVEFLTIVFSIKFDENYKVC